MNRLILLFLGISTTLFCQTNTEIHVFDILLDDENYLLKNGKNISNNEGYDSQPYFYDLEKILYASNRNGNTEIVLTNINSAPKTANIRSSTPNGGEYSPQKIPNSSHFSAVRLDNDIELLHCLGALYKI